MTKLVDTLRPKQNALQKCVKFLIKIVQNTFPYCIAGHISPVGNFENFEIWEIQVEYLKLTLERFNQLY